jgi:hypothetical protein
MRAKSIEEDKSGILEILPAFEILKRECSKVQCMKMRKRMRIMLNS